MSSTLKQAIQALKSRVADAFAAVEAKGGTLPATQDSANLPAAIASIPSGGGATGLYYNFEQYGVDAASIAHANRMYERDILASLPIDGTVRNVPYIVYSSDIASQANQLRGNNKIKCAFIEQSPHFELYMSFYQCSSLEYVIFSPDANVHQTPGYYNYLLFGSCGRLRAVLGYIFEVEAFGSMFQGANSIQEIYIKWTSTGGTTQLRNWALIYDSILFFIQNLPSNPTSGATIAIGATNLATLNATQEGQDAIAAATANGWTIAA